MSRTYVRREESFEAKASRAISEGAAFANSFLEFGPRTGEPGGKAILETISRLREGDIINDLNSFGLKRMEVILVRLANEMRPGYGDRAMQTYTDEDVLFDPKLENIRDLIERYKAFLFVQSQVKSGLQARRLLSQNSGSVDQ